MKRIVIILLLFIMGLSLFQVDINGNDNIKLIAEEYQLELYKARVLEIKDTLIFEDESGKVTTVQIAKIEIMNKEYKGMISEIRNTLIGDPNYDIELRKGTNISVRATKDNENNISFYIMNYERTNSINSLVTIFVIFVLLIAGWKGFKALLALVITIILILYILIPFLLKGYNPILLSVIICALSTLITFIITTGFNKKSIAAIIGTIGGLIVGGVIAYLYGSITKITGLSSADATALLYLPNNVDFDFRGLLFAGIIIGALGACMDVAISISSSLTEIQKENPSISLNKLLRSGLNIGKDIMGTMINTLVLAYTGGALPILLIFTGFQKTYSEIINLDSIVTEIVRAIAGSIGLLFTIPFTILAFGVLSKIKKNNERCNNEMV